MPHDPPIPRQDGRSEPETLTREVTTVEWGEAEPNRRRRTPRWLDGISHDERLVPVIAGLGVVAVIASLIGEWTVTIVPNAGPDGEAIVLSDGVADVATFGAGYMVGVLGIVGCASLVLYGSPAVRHNARILGLTLAGAVLVLLVAASSALMDTTERPLVGPDDGTRMEYGRGLTMAYLGTLAIGLALMLAGRFVRRPATGVTGAPLAQPHPPADGADPYTGGAEAVAGSTGAGDPTASGGPATPDGVPQPTGPVHHPGWLWRRPRARQDPADDRPAPSDLTVGPVAPFAHPDQHGGR
jgi:hypothetical protein